MGCSSTKRLTKDQALVTKLSVKGVNEEFEEQAASYVSLDIRPNSPFNLWVYNTFNKKGKKKLGEAPHLLDSSLVEVSRNQMEKFLNIKGFLNAKVKDSIAIKDKKAQIYYIAHPGKAFKFRNINYDIPDTAIKALYLANRKSFTQIHSGARYDADSLGFEREKIFNLMKKNGYYDFIRQYVKEEVDTNFNSSVADVMISILNPPNGKHQVYTLGNTGIRIRPSNGLVTKDMKPDTAVIDSQYYFYDYSHFFKPAKISKYIFLKKGDLYNLDQSNFTNKRLFDLNTFKNVSIDFRKAADSSAVLNGLIDMVPIKKKSNTIDGDFTFNSSVTGFNLGLTYQDHNFLGGGEVFQVKTRGGLQFDKNQKRTLSDRILSKDFQAGISLAFPRLITPFNLPNLTKNGVPNTRISLSYQNYKLTNTYLRRSFGTGLSYNWTETKYKLHSFTPVNIQYSKGDINPNLVDSLIKNGNVYFLLSLRSQIVSSSIYNYTYNLSRLNSLSKFTYFYGSLELGGNTMALLSKALGNKPTSTGNKTVFGVPYYQFVKAETDVRFYKYLGGERQFVIRLNPGIGFAYGNVKSLPFDKQYFAGGSTGIRAWQARTLGPGNYNRSELSSDTARINLRNLDQLGDLKFEGNLEYRFKLMDDLFGAKVKGATFVDFGNIWSLRGNGFAGSQINFNKLFSQIAVGTGFGLRFDVSFFVFRLDVGLKVKDPQFVGSDQYVAKYWFNRSAKRAFKNNYSITNSPDKYSITQIQFGVGMPF